MLVAYQQGDRHCQSREDPREDSGPPKPLRYVASFCVCGWGGGGRGMRSHC